MRREVVAVSGSNTVEVPFGLVRAVDVSAPELPFTDGVAADMIYIRGVGAVAAGLVGVFVLRRRNKRV